MVSRRVVLPDVPLYQKILQNVFPCSATLADEMYDFWHSWTPKTGTRAFAKNRKDKLQKNGTKPQEIAGVFHVEEDKRATTNVQIGLVFFFSISFKKGLNFKRNPGG